MSGHNHTPEVHDHADAWHHHSDAEGVPQTEHMATLNTVAIARWGLAITVMLVAFVIATGMYFSKYTARLRADRQEREAWAGLSAEAQGLRDSAEAVLSAGGKPETYSWVSDQEGRVQLPIDKAMRKVVQRYQERN